MSGLKASAWSWQTSSNVKQLKNGNATKCYKIMAMSRYHTWILVSSHVCRHSTWTLCTDIGIRAADGRNSMIPWHFSREKPWETLESSSRWQCARNKFFLVVEKYLMPALDHACFVSWFSCLFDLCFTREIFLHCLQGGCGKIWSVT